MTNSVIPPSHGREHFIAKFKRKAFSVNTFNDIMDVSSGTLKRSLKGWQLLLLGVGTMVGAGVFVSTGAAAQDKAGPVVSMSYLVAGCVCALSALCYAEYACELPMAGGAFNFVTITFGEFAGWLTATNLFIEWTVANAATAKGFSGYFCALTGISQTFFQPYSNGFIQIDWLSLVFCAFLTALLLLGTAESAMIQNVSVCVYLVLIAFIIIFGATQVDSANYTPFSPYGVDGVFKGVTTVFFSYVGFDMVASLAEEAADPAVDLPIGILGSLGLSTCIYIAMSTVLTGMVSYADLDPTAPFSSVFTAKGLEWAAKIVAVGAILGCSNSNYGGFIGQSRIFFTMARAGLLPTSLGRMNSRMVPYLSIFAAGSLAGLLAFFINLDSMWDLVSIGTLFAYGAVCMGCLWKRYNVAHETPVRHQRIMILQICGIIGCGLWAGFGNQYHPGVNYMWAIPSGLFFPLAGAFHLFPQRCLPTKGFAVPWLPWVPAAGIMMNGFLIGTLSHLAFMFWGVWMAISIMVYLLYGLHHTQGEGRPSVADISGVPSVFGGGAEVTAVQDLATAEAASAAMMSRPSALEAYTGSKASFLKSVTDLGLSLRKSSVVQKNT